MANIDWQLLICAYASNGKGITNPKMISSVKFSETIRASEILCIDISSL